MTRIRRPLIAGNWKMNGLHVDSINRVENILTSFSKNLEPSFDIIISPPATMLATISSLVTLSNVYLCGQDCHHATYGAHTGDVSATMLADAGCSYVIVGHSERRISYNETNDLVRRKATTALEAGLTAIICIGEREDQRNAGDTNDIIIKQLSESLPPQSVSENVIVAYEPIWAIGTGLTPSKDDVQYTHHLIRENLSKLLSPSDANEIRLLYGGSLKPENARELLMLPDVDGGLVGGASLDWQDFMAIAECYV